MIRVENTRQNEVAQANLVSTISPINLRCLLKSSRPLVFGNWKVSGTEINQVKAFFKFFSFFEFLLTALVEILRFKESFQEISRDREERERRRSSTPLHIFYIKRRTDHKAFQGVWEWEREIRRDDAALDVKPNGRENFRYSSTLYSFTYNTWRIDLILSHSVLFEIVIW